VDPAREAALMAAFDAARPGATRSSRRFQWAMAALASAAAVLIAVVIESGSAGRHVTPPPLPSRDARLEPSSGFVTVPGAAGLPPLESGTLVRMDVPVSMLPSLGVIPPAGSQTAVIADVIVAQDGLPRAVRLVNQP
jgi:hypothetical protein